MSKPLVVVGDDEPAALTAIVDAFRDHNCETLPAPTPEAFTQINQLLVKQGRVPGLEVLDLQFGPQCPPRETEQLAQRVRNMYDQPITILAYSALPKVDLMNISVRGYFDRVVSKDEHADALVAGIIAESGEQFLEAINSKREDAYGFLIVQGSESQAKALAAEAKRQRCYGHAVWDFDSIALGPFEMKERDKPCHAIITGLQVGNHSVPDVLEAVHMAELACHPDNPLVVIYSGNAQEMRNLRDAGVITLGYSKDETQPDDLIKRLRRRLSHKS